MRDNHEDLPELISAFERDGNYFGEISMTIKNETRTYEFVLTPQAYRAFKKMTSTRPFDTTPGLKYRYFFVPKVGGTYGAETRTIAVRIEEGKKGKNFDVEAPVSLIANLMWFFELKDFSEAAHLKETPKPRT